MVRAGGGLDLPLTKDHGAGLGAADIAEEGGGAVAGGGALSLEDEGPLVSVVGHFVGDGDRVN